jgi:DNA-binding MarR family transcriptional regulator/N-acetylglutamate synthase-like GNAT family acetyltransferase
MQDAAIRQVRRFNRTVTERVGALNDRYLGRQRPLGEARLLWEIGPDAADVRELRARLLLDSGQLSRMLRALEGQKIVKVEESAADRRVREVRLTAKGKKERRELDRRSNVLAGGMLEPLSERQRQRLLAAMAEVESLLSASLVEIAPCDPEERDARSCLEQYFAELAVRFDGGFDPSVTRSAQAADLRPPHGVMLLARLRGQTVGCGALKLRPGVPAEIKRMWVSHGARGLGVGRRLLQELEARARTAGARVVRLDTNRNLKEAIELYRRTGYKEVPAFNQEPYAHFWFAKRLR